MGYGIAKVKRLKSAATAPLVFDVPPQKLIRWHPRRTTAVIDKFLRGEILKNLWMTAAELKKAHPNLLGNVAEQTIQNYLQNDL